MRPLGIARSEAAFVFSATTKEAEAAISAPTVRRVLDHRNKGRGRRGTVPRLPAGSSGVRHSEGSPATGVPLFGVVLYLTGARYVHKRTAPPPLNERRYHDPQNYTPAVPPQ